MPLGLNINNPQEENPTVITDTPVEIGGATYGGNVLGAGSSSTSGAPTSASSGLPISTILIYGLLALVAIWIIQRMEK